MSDTREAGKDGKKTGGKGEAGPNAPEMEDSKSLKHASNSDITCLQRLLLCDPKHASLHPKS
jgi:hypothetical protein